MTSSRTIGGDAESFTQPVHSVEDHTGLPGVDAGGGAWEFVKTVELMAPAATINVTGLNGDQDERYLMLYDFIHDNAGGVGGGANVRLQPNGDTVNGRTSHLQYAGSVASTEHATEIHIATVVYVAGENLVRVQGELIVYAGGLTGQAQMFKSTDAISRQGAPNSPFGNLWIGAWNSLANITSITFDLFLKNFHTGTKIHVYKLKKS